MSDNKTVQKDSANAATQPAASPPRRSRSKRALDSHSQNIVTWVMAALILLLALYVALSPGVFYAPTPRTILYLLVALLPAILFADRLNATLNFSVPGFVLTAGGAGALILGTLLLLTHLSKPAEQISVFSLRDEDGQDLFPIRVEVTPPKAGLKPTLYHQKNAVILIFPEQVGEVEMRVWEHSNEPPFSGKVTYTGSHSGILTAKRETHELVDHATLTK